MPAGLHAVANLNSFRALDLLDRCSPCCRANKTNIHIVYVVSDFMDIDDARVEAELCFRNSR